MTFIPSDSHSGFYFPPPANGWRSPFLSRTGNVLHSFLLCTFTLLTFIRISSASFLQSARIARSRESNLDSCRPMSLGSYHPANLLIRTDSKQSLENRNGSRSEVCLSDCLWLCASAHSSCFSLYLRMRSSGAEPTVSPSESRRSMAISLNTS